MEELEKNVELLTKLALKHYPKDITYSMGESYDSNEHKREAFVKGFLLALELAAKV